MKRLIVLAVCVGLLAGLLAWGYHRSVLSYYNDRRLPELSEVSGIRLVFYEDGLRYQLEKQEQIDVPQSDWSDLLSSLTPARRDMNPLTYAVMDVHIFISLKDGNQRIVHPFVGAGEAYFRVQSEIRTSGLYWIGGNYEQLCTTIEKVYAKADGGKKSLTLKPWVTHK